MTKKRTHFTDQSITGGFEENPFKRLSLYSHSAPGGGVLIDGKTLAEDWITVMKMNEISFDQAVEGLSIIWPMVEVGISVPDKEKN